MNNIEFGVMLRQQKIDFQIIKDTAQLIDELGYDSIWFFDHLLGQGAYDADIYEPWTLMSALSGVTENVKIGTMVLCGLFRPPALLAKMASTLDVISNGRLEFALGAGWFKEEFESYGYRFPKTRERIEILGEIIRITRSLWTEEKTSFNGDHFQISDAFCNPKPIQSPHPPIIIGGSGEKFLLRLVAELADEWNCPASAALSFDRKLKSLENHCNDVGRDINDITLSQQTVCVIVDVNNELDEKLSKAQRRYGFFGNIEKLGIVGTPDQCINKIKEDINKGISKYTIFFSDIMNHETLKLFASEVIKEFKN